MLTYVSRCDICDGDRLAEVSSAARIWKCERCGFAFANPRPSLDDLIKFYSKPGKYEDWLRDHESRQRLWRRRLRKVLRSAHQGSLLDVGAGIGQFLNMARPHFSSVNGTEVSSVAVQISSDQYGLSLHQGVLEELELGSTYSNVTLFHVLEHVPSPRAMLEICFNLLSPGGRLFIAVPNDNINEPRRLPTKPTGYDGGYTEFHLSHFSRESLTRVVSRSGLYVLETSRDPYFVTSSILTELKEVAKYKVSWLHQAFTRHDIYPALWLVAERPPC